MYRNLFVLTFLAFFSLEMLTVTAAPLGDHLEKLSYRRFKRDVTSGTAQDDGQSDDQSEEFVPSVVAERAGRFRDADSLPAISTEEDTPRRTPRRRSRRSAVWLLHATMHLCEKRPHICSIKLKDGDTEVDIRLESE